MPARAMRPYAESIERRRLDVTRAADPIRKLYKTADWSGVHGTRQMVLRRDPTCCLCKAAASVIVHHVIAAREYIRQHDGDAAYFFDLENLQGLCKPCHDCETAVEASLGRRWQ
jgi:5-methylcytosine-specific restriction protein A